MASFVLLVVTGAYLSQFYDPTPASAPASVVYITDKAFAGALIRSLHYWLSTAFVVALILHMVRTFATASFKAPREGIWITGVVLFLLAAGLLFTGTVLKPDQESLRHWRARQRDREGLRLCRVLVLVRFHEQRLHRDEAVRGACLDPASVRRRGPRRARVGGREGEGRASSETPRELSLAPWQDCDSSHRRSLRGGLAPGSLFARAASSAPACCPRPSGLRHLLMSIIGACVARRGRPPRADAP
jgi:hypothetical protein